MILNDVPTLNTILFMTYNFIVFILKLSKWYFIKKKIPVWSNFGDTMIVIYNKKKKYN